MERNNAKRTRPSTSQRGFLTGLVLLICTALGWSYSEDIRTDNTEAHSTFHYEFTRTLARAAGFSPSEAELIAVADEATDTGHLQGDSADSPSIQIQGTERPAVGGDMNPVGLYYHFARRGAANATGEYTYPGGRNTCVYFNGTSDPCPVNEGGRPVPELEELELWAVYGRSSLRLTAPQISVNGSPNEPVAPRSLPALGIYLHALADSYSHEACMEADQFRGHKNSPPACNTAFWHLEAEFGTDRRDVGVPYTKEGGMATWLALKWFRQQNGLTRPALWNDDTAQSFITKWVELDNPQDRRESAVSALESLPSARYEPEGLTAR